MNIYEISEKHKISLHKLRAMDHDKLLRFDNVEDDRASLIRHYLARNTNATVEHLLWLIESPAMLADMGKYAERLRVQIAGLSDPKTNAAPFEIAAYIDDAARSDPDALALVAQWLRDVLPAKPVEHAWIATRLLFGLPENSRTYNIKRIPMALLNVRNIPEFSGWFKIIPRGSQKVTVYAKPKMIDM